MVWKSPDTPLVAPVEVTPVGTVDYDTDDDGLVEVSTLAQLEAIRWDADGDGYSDHGGLLHEGFASALAQMGCPSSGCVGYELAADLDFDTNASGDADEGDEFWNSGHGWVPIGADTHHFSGVLEGNGYTIRNLFIDSDDVKQSIATGYKRVDWSGRYVESRSIHLGPGTRVGGLVGINDGTIIASYATGTASSEDGSGGRVCSHPKEFVGGLTSHNGGSITASYALVSVSGKNTQPLVETTAGGSRVHASYWNFRHRKGLAQTALE